MGPNRFAVLETEYYEFGRCRVLLYASAVVKGSRQLLLVTVLRNAAFYAPNKEVYAEGRGKYENYA